ncbi:WXG100 family type VII secretion target [Brachybacterium sp. AOP43-C2-M15]|uniref:WXG100 family type VII secretion target n=1 Tax=Brachybacterium sp. AOP43-C2-M15 TaxID=3457661 RepID=UPI0040338327
MAFKGMNPEEGREVAQAVTEAGEQILEAIDNVTSIVNSVEWVGPDYDAYRDEWNSFTGGAVAELVNGLQTKGNELTQHAEEQDTTSNQQ